MRASPAAAPSLAEYARRIRERAISAEQLLDQLLARIDADNAAINAVVVLDRDGARARARAADAALARGRLNGPLHGLPMTVKDAFEVQDMVCACGSPSLVRYRPSRNAVAAQRLIDAGANLIGKTNTPLFCGDFQTWNAVYGVTGNPWDLDRSPGGSSGGAAAALAAGFTLAELGSDIGGSLRNPAHMCGVYSHKPSYGLIPMRGHIPGPPGTLSEADLAVAGPMARRAEDLDLLLKVLSADGMDSGDNRPVALRPPRAPRRIRLWTQDEDFPIAATLADGYRALGERLRAAGFEVRCGAPEGLRLRDDFVPFMRLLAAALGASLPKRVYRRMRWTARWARWRGIDDPSRLAGYAAAATLSHRDWLRLNEARWRRRAVWDQVFRSDDLVLMPVTPTTAIAHQHHGNLFTRRIEVDGTQRPYTDLMAWISPATLADLPATTAPIGLFDGLPAGVQILAPRGHDRSAIAFAAQLAGLCPPPTWPGLAAREPAGV